MSDEELVQGEEGGGEDLTDFFDVDRPHDSLFGLIFSAGDHARVLLEAAFPAKVLAEVELSNLVPLRTKSHGPGLDQRDADLVFEARTRDDEPVVIRLLIEHQSTDDPLMALRVAEYKIRDTVEWVGRNKRSKTIPPALAVVVSQCEKAWTAPRRLSELYGLSPAKLQLLQPGLIDDLYYLEDLYEPSEEEIKARPGPPAALAALLLMKEVRKKRPDVLALVRRMADLLGAVAQSPDSGRMITALVVYIGATAPRLDVPELGRVMRETMGKQGARAVGTLFDQLRTEGSRRLLLEQLEAKFPGLPADIRERVASGSDPEIRRWGTRFAAATTLAEVFAGE